jgi:outer membrane protein OmpU
MKKILLATTFLTMTAGLAAADITFAGSATMGVAQNGTANGGDTQATIEGLPKADAFADDKMLSYSTASLVVTFAGQSDSGLTFGASFDMTGGTSYALANDDGFADESENFGDPTVFVSGSFGKLTISTNNMDGFDGDEVADGSYDAQYDGTFGGVTVGVQADIESGMMGVKAGYAAGALALDASYSQQPDPLDDIWDLSATYTMGAIAVTAATDNAEDSSLKVAYAGATGISAFAQYNTNTGTDDASFDIGGGYAANALTVSVEVDNVSEANAGVAEWTVTAAYDLGGGLSVEAGTNYTEDMMVGASMAF